MSTHGGVSIFLETPQKISKVHLFRYWDGMPKGMLTELLPFFKMIMDGTIPLDAKGSEVHNPADWLIYMGHLAEKEVIERARGGAYNLGQDKFSIFERVMDDNRTTVEYYYVVSFSVDSNGNKDGKIMVWNNGKPPSETGLSGYDFFISPGFPFPSLKENIEHYAKKYDVDLQSEMNFYKEKINNIEFFDLRNKFPEKF